jgi:hypothetical protein
VLASVIPWVNNAISHQLGMGFSLGCLGHTASQLRVKARNRCASTVCASDGIIDPMGRGEKEEKRGEEEKRNNIQEIPSGT